MNQLVTDKNGGRVKNEKERRKGGLVSYLETSYDGGPMITFNSYEVRDLLRCTDSVCGRLDLNWGAVRVGRKLGV
ncbi:unnamed protein product [Sphenostylis stenocarpa]|uniref:Uncharacterized protein n=1 Tax=Sphenostylis stenocarpa TaxID=92480 RepID=A0AA86W2N8_9FABA|nr:unnamed protein product [Sphenostylis stenocarpa]